MAWVLIKKVNNPTNKQNYGLSDARYMSWYVWSFRFNEFLITYNNLRKYLPMNYVKGENMCFRIIKHA